MSIFSKIFWVLCLSSISLFAQIKVAAPNLLSTGTSLPNTCTVGSLFFKSDATAGQNLYECQSPDMWTQQLNSGGAPTNAQYIVLALNGSLSAERVLTAGSGIGFTDDGANSTLTVAFDSSVLTGNFLANSGSNTLLAGIGNICVPSLTTECWRLSPAQSPSTIHAGSLNVSLSSGFGWANATAYGYFLNPVTAERTWTMQDANYVVIGRDTTDILTNKSISASQITAGTFGSGNYVFPGKLNIAQQTPASAGATCTANQFVFDTGFLYVCTTTDTWKRVAVSSW